MTPRCVNARRVGFLVGAMVVWGSGMPALGHGDLHERIEVLTERLEESPRDAELLLRRADLYRQHGEFDLALRDVATAQLVGGREADVLLLRGRTLLECGCGREGEAVGVLEGFVALRPDHGDGWLRLARARRATRDHEGSVEAYGQAIALMATPGPEIYLERADEVLQAKIGGGDARRGALEEACAGIEEGIERLGPVVTLELRAAELEVELGRTDAAVGRIEAVMAQAARKEAWLVRKGEILEGAGRVEEALVAYRAARESLRTGRGAVRDRSLREDIECAIERLDGARREATDEARQTTDDVETRDADR